MNINIKKIENNISKDFESLEILLNRTDVDNYRYDIIELTKSIISYKDKITESGINHDYGNATGGIGKIQMIMDGLFDGDVIKHFELSKNAVFDILNIKENYSIVEIKTMIEELSSIKNININISFNDSLQEIDSFEYRRLFQNLVTNSKEAGAQNINIIFGVTNLESGLSINYIDDGKGMTDNIITNVLFKKGCTTKSISGTNKGEGMYGLVNLFNNEGIKLEIYTNGKDGFLGRGFSSQTFNDIMNGINDISGSTIELLDYYNKEGFKFKTGSEFIFTFKKKA